MTNPVEALTQAFLEADGYDPEDEMYELKKGLADSGIAAKFRTLAEIAVDTLKGIGWGEVEPYREALERIAQHGDHNEPHYCHRCVASKTLSRWDEGKEGPAK